MTLANGGTMSRNRDTAEASGQRLPSGEEQHHELSSLPNNFHRNIDFDFYPVIVVIAMTLTMTMGGFSRSSQQQFVEPFCWSVPVQGLAWSAVEFGGDAVEVFAGVHGEVCAFGEVLAQQPVGRSYVCQDPFAAGFGRVAAWIRR